MTTLSSLVDLLAWGPDTASLEGIQRDADQVIADALERCLAAAADEGDHAAVAEIVALAQEDPGALARTLRAPHARYVLVAETGTPEARRAWLGRLASALRAEHAIRTATPSDDCSAFGERGLPRADALGQWIGECLRVTDGPVLDYGSALWEQRRLPQYERHDEADRRNASATCARALSVLAAATPPVHAFIGYGTRALLCYRDPSSRMSFAGSQRFRFGQIEYVNAHRMPLADWMESLVHESIHVVIESIELFEPLYRPASVRAGRLVTSPWSGRDISTTAAAHACFVWYGLYWFWNALLQKASTFPDLRASAKERCERAARGFQRPLGSLVEDAVEPAALPLFDVLRTRVVMHQRERGTNPGNASAHDNSRRLA